MTSKEALNNLIWHTIPTDISVEQQLRCGETINKDLKALDKILSFYANADKMGFNDIKFYTMICNMAKERGYKIQ